jgi:transcriptional regulator with XRE-family HTH domain
MPVETKPLTATEAVAAEVRAHMGRRNLRQVHLAQAIGQNTMWLSRRLSGEVSFSIEDLERICQILNIDMVALIQPVAA